MLPEKKFFERREWRKTEWFEITTSRPGVVVGSEQICKIQTAHISEEESNAISDIIVTAGNLSQKYNIGILPYLFDAAQKLITDLDNGKDTEANRAELRLALESIIKK